MYRLGIKEVAAKVGVIAGRVDEQNFTEPMLERIYRQIAAADIIIAEMTGQNHNVFYEVGYAHAKEKLCILSTAEAAGIPLARWCVRMIPISVTFDSNVWESIADPIKLQDHADADSLRDHSGFYRGR